MHKQWIKMSVEHLYTFSPSLKIPASMNMHEYANLSRNFLQTVSLAAF